jgi:hypothetical protein
MAQIFHRSFNTISRLTIFGAIFFITFLFWAYSTWTRSGYATGQESAIDQPVPFSHKHHVAGLGIDCRYCHNSVEKSGFAGIPPTHTCMNCHQQIWVNSPLLKPVRDSYKDNTPIPWVRVHNLAEFVYFDHSIHIHKGIGCTTCHGPIQEMNLTYQYASLYMEWCLNCHRDPAKYVRPKEEVFNWKWQPQDLQKSKYLYKNLPEHDQKKLFSPEQMAQPGWGDLHLTPLDLVKLYDIKKRTDCSTCHR